MNFVVYKMKKSNIPNNLSITRIPTKHKTGLTLQGAGFRRKHIKTLYPPRLKVVRSGRGRRRKRVGRGLLGLAASVLVPALLSSLG